MNNNRHSSGSVSLSFIFFKIQKRGRKPHIFKYEIPSLSPSGFAASETEQLNYANSDITVNRMNFDMEGKRLHFLKKEGIKIGVFISGTLDRRGWFLKADCNVKVDKPLKYIVETIGYDVNVMRENA